jgi:hypothetical protein
MPVVLATTIHMIAIVTTSFRGEDVLDKLVAVGSK